MMVISNYVEASDPTSAWNWDQKPLLVWEESNKNINTKPIVYFAKDIGCDTTMLSCSLNGIFFSKEGSRGQKLDLIVVEIFHIFVNVD